MKPSFRLQTPQCVALLTLLASHSASAATWDGDAATNSPSDRSWAAAANWVGDAVPSDGSAIVFDHRASGLTNLLNASRTASSLDMTYTATGSSSHTVDLNTHTLAVSGWLDVGHERTVSDVAGSASVTFRNGAIQLADGASVHVACGGEFRMKNTGGLVLGPTAAWRAGTLDELWLSSYPSGQAEGDGTVDLSALTQPSSLVWLDGAAEVPGTLCVDSLRVGYDLEDRNTGKASFSIGTALTQLVVRTEFFVGVASGASLSLPSANVFYRIGDATAGRADVRITVAGGNRDAAGTNVVWTPAGGGFHAYLSSLQLGIGSSSDRAGGYWRAVLDLTNTTVTAFDVSGDVTLGGAQAITGTGRGQGTLRLPAVSARIGGTLRVDKGGASTERFGLLELHGTQLTVEGSVTVNAKGTVRCVFNGQSQGGDWFLRMPGDQVQAWQDHIAAGRMTAVGAPSGAKFGAWASGGYTHLGLLYPTGTILLLK